MFWPISRVSDSRERGGRFETCISLNKTNLAPDYTGYVRSKWRLLPNMINIVYLNVKQPRNKTKEKKALCSG